MNMNKSIFVIYMPKFINYSSKDNCPADFGLDHFLVFILYLAFRHSDLSKVSFL
jgi:hypothetical protein